MAMKKIEFCVFLIITIAFLFAGCQDNRPVIGPYPQEGYSSWYIPRRTASGERVEKDALTCALRRRDFGEYYEVCNLENQKCVTVRHNDFGPSARMFMRQRIIDLSKSAFLRIADLKNGIVRVKIRKIKNE